MDLQCENNEKHSIQTYDQHSVQVDNQQYHETLLISASQLTMIPQLKDIVDITPALVLDNLTPRPTIVLIGHHQLNTHLLPKQLHEFIQQGIGVECMPFDAACRTFNILLGEGRTVAVLLVM
ncbi:MAG: MTH938/NDUFAF3 family protein [Gammaproteobacteria bacterium]|nr:MTH938/NDUFAF3 family protein [Gammaproteobacteria bacterium]